MQKLCDMKYKILKTEEEYNLACERVYELIHSSESNLEPVSEAGEELELLSLLVDDYEKRMNYKMLSPDPVEVIKIKMQEKHLKTSDLIPLMGSKSTVSKILNHKRPMTVEIVKKISRELNIPVGMLV